MTVRAPVMPPPAAPPRYGLLTSAAPANDAPGTRWVEGITYDPETGVSGYRTDVCDPGATDRAIAAPDGIVEWDPYVIGAGIRCTALAAPRQDWRARARRALDSQAEAQISAELWTGELAQEHGYPNRWLADVTSVDILTESGPVGLTHGLACLEQYLAECNGGQRGMIHATPQVATHWQGLDLLRREGKLLLTVLDTIVVPGSGYTGTDPDGNVGDGNVWAYATGMVTVRRDDQVDYAGDPLANPEQVNRSTNLVELRAEQLALASWDGICHGGVRLDVTTCNVGGS